MGIMRVRRARQRTRSVREDWVAWIPNEMDSLFEATRRELESTNVFLSIILDEALSNCKQGLFESAKESADIFGGLFDRLSKQVCQVARAVKEHGSRFGTLPHVEPLLPSNFRGEAAKHVSFMNQLLSRVLFRERTRFFHKLHSLDEIVADLQRGVGETVQEMVEMDAPDLDLAWQELEVLAYDLNTCMSEITIMLKSFFCALPTDELESFRQRLAVPLPASSRYSLDGRKFSIENK